MTPVNCPTCETFPFLREMPKAKLCVKYEVSSINGLEDVEDGMPITLQGHAPF